METQGKGISISCNLEKNLQLLSKILDEPARDAPENDSIRESEDEFFELASESGVVDSESFTVFKSSVRPTKSLFHLSSQSKCELVKTPQRPKTVRSKATSQISYIRKPTVVEELFRKQKKSQDSVMKLTKSPPKSANSLKSSSLDPIESLKCQLSFQTMRAIQSQDRAAKLSKTIEQLRSKLTETEKLHRDAERLLKEKNERNKISIDTVKLQREKNKKLQDQNFSLKITVGELQEKLKTTENFNLELVAAVQDLKKESKLLMLSNESLLAELKSVSNVNSTNLEKIESNQDQKIENLKIELNSRELQIDILKLELEQLKEDSVRV